MKINNLSYLFVAGALALASCSHDEYTGPDYAGSKLVVNATISGMQTRAGNSMWEAGDAIGISSDQGHDNLHFISEKGDGVFSPADDIYVLGAGETNLTAYYPHHVEVNSDLPVVNFDQPEDFMYSTATVTRENSKANMTFKHHMTKLSFNMIDESLGETENKGSISVSGLVPSGSFHTLTGDVTVGSEKGKLTKDFTANSTVGLIFPPQAVKQQLEVLVNYNDKVYGGYIMPDELLQGYDYNFSIDLVKADEAGKLSISSATISDWNKNENGDVWMMETQPERGENLVIEPGDFLLADGTTIDRKDPALKQFKKEVVGVVFYAGNPQPSGLYGYNETQDILLKNYPDAVNGLAIAINNANDGEAVKISTAKYSFSTWYQSDGKDSSTANPNFIGKNLNLTAAGTEMLGYNNTMVIKAASEELGDETAGMADFLKILEDYNDEVKVEGASDWYLPSYAELAAIIENYDDIAASVEKVGGELTVYKDYGETTDQNFYWSSDMRGGNYHWVSPLWVSDDLTLFLGKNSSSIQGFFRFAIAF